MTIETIEEVRSRPDYIKDYIEKRLRNTSSLTRLHLGCGNIHLDGFINVDTELVDAADIVTDLVDLPEIPDNSIDHIYACHVLQQYNFDSLSPGGILSHSIVLEGWIRKLKPGGVMSISVPNMPKLIEGMEKFKNDPDITIKLLNVAYGNITTNYTMFNEQFLASSMQKAGLQNIKPFWPFVNDNSRFVIRGIDVSLNLRGYKS